MEKYSVLNDTIYFDERSSVFLLYDLYDKDLKILEAITPVKIYKRTKSLAYVFGVALTNNCNLKCKYCFNHDKNEKQLGIQEIISKIEFLFNTFPDGERYTIDLSGIGEPLLALKKILEISEYCKKKSDEMRREVLVQFVCNGTMLTKETAETLQKHNVLFGVSIDGNEMVHNHYRKNGNGLGEYNNILNNVLRIERKEYIGCACTLTDIPFSLSESLQSLSKVFNTISYRFARGINYSEEVIKSWIKEYDNLSFLLLNQLFVENLSYFKILMNGDDLFGKFLCRAFGFIRVSHRCDAGIKRFSIGTDGNIYGCSAATISKINKINTDDLKKYADSHENEQILLCSPCKFKTICGGMCELELNDITDSDKNMCKIYKHLILLSNYIQQICFQYKPDLHEQIREFVMKKYRRNFMNPNLKKYLDEHQDISFMDARKLFND